MGPPPQGSALTPRCASCVHAVVQNGVSLLHPYPSREAQDPSDPANILYVQSMEIDTRGRMWVLDVGRVSRRSISGSISSQRLMAVARAYCMSFVVTPRSSSCTSMTRTRRRS